MNNVTELPPPSYDPSADRRDDQGMVEGIQYHQRTPVEQVSYDQWVAAGKPERFSDKAGV